jgi:hypothetical protein
MVVFRSVNEKLGSADLFYGAQAEERQRTGQEEVLNRKPMEKDHSHHLITRLFCGRYAK